MNNKIDLTLEPKVFVVLICGIPGVGKTFLSEKLTNNLNSSNDNYKAFNLNFDETFVKESYDKSCEKFDLFKFKIARKKFLEKFKNLFQELKQCQSGKNIIFVDDNFYLKSMRKPFYKLILTEMYINIEFRKRNTYVSYLEIHLKSNLDYAIKNNNKRNSYQKIPEEILRKIEANFQYNSFHKQLILSINVKDENTIYNDFVQEFSTKIIVILEKNYCLLKENIEKEGTINKLQQFNAKSIFIENLENSSRKIIGESIKLHPGLKKLAYELSLIKSGFLDIIKNILKYNDKKGLQNDKVSEKIQIFHDINFQVKLDEVKSQNYSLELIPDILKFLYEMIREHFKL